jgi:hypothetical protein
MEIEQSSSGLYITTSFSRSSTGTPCWVVGECIVGGFGESGGGARPEAIATAVAATSSFFSPYGSIDASIRRDTKYNMKGRIKFTV